MSYKTKFLVFFPLLLAVSYSNINFSNKSYQVECEICFTPGENCTQKIVNEILNAKEEILLQAYSFTSMPIIEALMAKSQEIKIIIIVDKSQAKNLSLKKLKSYGISIYIDSLAGIAHNKVIIIDRKKVFTGSFNFSAAAQHKNAENLLLIYSIPLTLKYIENFNKRKDESEIF